MKRINTSLITGISNGLRDMLGDEFDAETFWDTLDGEADVLDIADHILAKRLEDHAMATAAKQLAQDQAARAKRFADRDAAHKSALMAILSAAGETKLERPGGTVSMRKGGTSVNITNEADVPTQLCKTTVTPDKAAIKKALQQGEAVPGAELVTGSETISVRVA